MKKLNLSHETLRSLTSDHLAGVAGGQMSGSSGPTLANQFGSNVDDRQRRIDEEMRHEDRARRRG
jgi:hypothetical protein